MLKLCRAVLPVLASTLTKIALDYVERRHRSQ